MGVIKYKPGDVIIEEGSFGSSAYVIDSGKVEVSGTVDGKKIVFATLGAKQIFGEMGLIEDKPRSATITAVEDTQAREISREGFNELFEKNPKVLLPIVKALFERLRTATKMAAVKIAAATQPSAAVAPEEKIIDERYVVMSGMTEFAKKALEYAELEIKEFPFKVGRYTLGYSSLAGDVLSDNDFLIKEDSTPYYVSKNHFMIDKVDGNFVVVDRGSRLGVIVNDKKVTESCILTKEETEVIIGSQYSPFSFKFTIKGQIRRIGVDAPEFEKISTEAKSFESVKKETKKS